MKKFLLLFIAATFTFASCGDDDDSGSQDQIVGVWTLHKEFENDVEELLTNCDRQEKFVFNENGNLDYEDYYQEDEMADCILDETVSGTWSNDGNNTYSFISALGNALLDITFENNTFSYSDEYTEEDETYTYKVVYIRN